MALIKCIECGHSISDKAEMCPKCGCPVSYSIEAHSNTAVEENISSEENISMKDNIIENNDETTLKTPENDIKENLQSEIARVNDTDRSKESKDNKSTSKIQTIIFPVFACLVVLILLGLALPKYLDKGSFDITQNFTTVELGDNVKIDDCFSFDKELIQEVKILNDGGFNANKVGNYSIKINVVNVKGNNEEQEYSIEVIDTTAPTIHLSSGSAYVVMGDSFVPDTYATVNDKSGNYELIVEGEVDTNKAGKYEISYAAKDDSGNISEAKRFVVVVEDRSNAIVNDIAFGDSRETVKRYKSGCELWYDGDDQIAFVEKFEGREVYAYYFFDKNNTVERITLFTPKHDSVGKDQYISDFNNIRDSLNEIYGEPSKNKEWTGRLAKYCDTYGEALSMGEYSRACLWESEDYFILAGQYAINMNNIYSGFEFYPIEELSSIKVFD